MIKVDEVKLKIGFDQQDVINECAKKLNITKQDILSAELLKLSIDARKKPNIYYVANVGLNLTEKYEKLFIDKKYNLNREVLKFKQKKANVSPIVVGFGPAGMFCALMLARMGLKPIVIEQGKCVEQREQDVLAFWNERKLNKYSNVQFGEGGAGTFSDGKLNTNLNSAFSNMVINEFYYYGAPKSILYQSKPHIGSDNLKKVVKAIRQDIISMGGQILFNTKLIDIGLNKNQVTHITVKDTITGEQKKLVAHKLILALGHSARDTFKMLYGIGMEIKQKPFAMGVRIEQKQSDINESQYGKGYDKRLPSADYKLVEHLKNGRSVFIFCMCPGGEVVASSSSEGEVVTNGMSYFARDKENANSAVLVNVNVEDYDSTHPLSGLDFQAKYEKLAFELGGSNFNAPCQTVGSFLGADVKTHIIPSYKPNVTWAELQKCLPNFVYDSLKQALPLFNKKIKNFALNKNVLTAIESRSSCPLYLQRDAHFESSIKGIYPIGEGAGYSGGIVSSAIDGIKVAEEIYTQF